MGRHGLRTSFDDKCATLRNKASGRLMATGSIVNNLYAINVDNLHPSPDKALVANLDLWHQRLAHVNASGIKSMADRDVVKGIKLNSNAEHNCNVCNLSKSHRTPFRHKSSSRTRNVLEIVHSNVTGPLEVDSVGGSKYVITFIDDYSNWVVSYTMRRKSEALGRFKEYKQYAENQTNRKLLKLHVHERYGS